MAMHVQVGFDLKHVKHYASVESAVQNVEKTLAPTIAAGVVFNILIVTQRKGGQGSDAEDLRYVPILNCWRAPASGPTATQYAIFAARSGFFCIT